MKAYGITKYRNLKGEIAEQEWISISDIGRSFGGVTLTAESYMDTEDAFVRIILRILDYMGVKKCKIKNIDKMDIIKSRPEIPVSDDVKALYTQKLWNFYDSLHENQEIDLMEMGDVIRLQLREDIWARVYVPYRFKLFIGYDYMVDVETSVSLDPILEELNNMGLYVFSYV